MKKITGMLTGLFITAIVVSCNNESEPAKKEVVKVPVPVEKKEAPKATSVTLDKSGVEVETKKVKVKVHPN